MMFIHKDVPITIILWESFMVLWLLPKEGGSVADKRGRSFLLSFLPLHDHSGSILLVISAFSDTVVTVKNDMFNISLTYDIAENDSVEVNLDPALRYRNHLEVERKAVVLNSIQDIAVHVFNFGKDSSDGYVALPLETLSKKYLIAAYNKQSFFSLLSNPVSSVSAFTIAAVRNNTTVKIRFKHPLSTCGVQPSSTPSLNSVFNQFRMNEIPQQEEQVDTERRTITLTINQYDVIGTNCTSDPTGTVVTSDEPISVVSGGVCSFVPHAMMPECDHMEEMMVPSEMFGSHYVLHELGGRPSGAIYRIIANENKTTISSTLGHGGELHETQAADINIKETGPMCLHTSKPVLLVMYAKGSRADVPESYGGPFMTIVIPTERFSTMPLHIPHLWNVSFISRKMTTYVTVIQKHECKENYDQFDQVRVLPKCDFAVATMKLSDPYKPFILVPEIKYGALIYGFGEGEGFGFSNGIARSYKSDLRVTTYCESFPCLNEGVCREGCPYRCLCKQGYLGRQCEKLRNNTYEPSFKDTDDCISNPCVRGICRDRIGAYKCLCHPGFYGVNCEKDIDECLGNPCLHGNCTDGVNTFICSCHPGYTGKLCDFNIDDCSPDPCFGHGDCRDGISNYSCLCRPGYTGINCQTDLDECVSNPCLNNGTCVDSINAYTCMCAKGFTGHRCENDIVECVSSPCKNGGYCQEGPNSYTCVCLAGYSGYNCEEDINDCSPNPCLHNGTCTDDVNNFFCVCSNGYEGQTCEIDIDECASSPCHHNATCTDGIDNYTCYCLPGYTGELCETDINDCSDHPCENNATCLDGINNYTCLCSPGYTGPLCQTDINDCASKPCSNNSLCIDEVNSFHCRCGDGYFGTTCEKGAPIIPTTSTLAPTTSTSTSAKRITTALSVATSPPVISSQSSATSQTVTTRTHKNISKMNVTDTLLLNHRQLGSSIRKHSTAHDSRLSSILIGCCVVLLAVGACVFVGLHDCMVYFWTPRRKIAASDMLRRHGLKNVASTYAVTKVTNVTTVMVLPRGGVPDVEETVT